MWEIVTTEVKNPSRVNNGLILCHIILNGINELDALIIIKYREINGIRSVSEMTIKNGRPVSQYKCGKLINLTAQ